MEYKLLDEQLEIISAVSKGRSSVMVEAGAGCAKTTTLKEASKGIKVEGLAVAFGKKNADDLAQVMPENIKAKSFNALGHQAWARSNKSGSKIQLEDRKIGRIVTELAKNQGLKLDTSQWDGTRNLVRMAMNMGLVPKSCGSQGLVEDSELVWKRLALESDLAAEDRGLWELARAALVESISWARKGVISFDDQVYCSSLLGGKFWKYQILLVDEDQDLSPLNIKMLELSIVPGGRIIAMGDKRQAIYAWRGAAGDSAERVKKLTNNWKELPLLTTFRCPKAIVARQQEHVPGYRAWSGAKDGSVHVIEKPKQVQAEDKNLLWPGWNWETLASKFPDPRSKFAVLCRNNAPLVKFAFKLIKEGIGVTMLGRDLGKNLAGLVNSFSKESIPVDVFLGKLTEWTTREISKAENSESKIESIYDKADCLRAIAETESVKDSEDILKRINYLFENQDGLVTLSSIHKAKGLEWDVVLLLDPWRIPSKMAKSAAKAGNLVPLEQELNAKYVAETRSKDVLILANLADYWEK